MSAISENNHFRLPCLLGRVWAGPGTHCRTICSPFYGLVDGTVCSTHIFFRVQREMEGGGVS